MPVLFVCGRGWHKGGEAIYAAMLTAGGFRARPLPTSPTACCHERHKIIRQKTALDIDIIPMHANLPFGRIYIRRKRTGETEMAKSKILPS